MTRLVHIVDDDVSLRGSTSFLLQGLGYATRVYEGGREFLAETRLDAPGCVLLDIYMPGMSGVEILSELKARGAHLPVIMLTGHGDVQVAVQAMKLGAVDFLEKPYEGDALAAAVERAFALSDKTGVARRLREGAAAKLEQLSPRELQILQGLRAGMANKAIARWLELSPRTIEAYRAKMMARLDVATFPELLRIAHDGGLPELKLAAA